MPKIIDLTGQRFGRLTVVGIAERLNGQRVKWICRCDCGNNAIVSGTHLKSGHTISCGCYKIEKTKEVNGKHFLSRKERLYVVWMNMRLRCRNPKNKRYKNYGGRGITICDQWEDYMEFRKWALENGYSENLTIDRIDVNGNYCPENCRWADIETQSNNRTNNHFIEALGQRMTAKQWGEKTGIPASTIIARINKLGWSDEKAVSTEVKK